MSNMEYAGILSRELNFPKGFEVSWAGPHPFQEGICLGSEDGLLQLYDMDLSPLGEPFKGSKSGEAINSVVGCGDWIVASTRRELSFLAKQTINGISPVGAHSLAVLSNGCVVAALGRKGLMLVRPGSTKPEDSFIIPCSTADTELSAYRVVAIPNLGIVCAARSGGILLGQWEEGKPNLNVLGFPGFDAIDVCSIGTVRYPLAVAAVSKDGNLIMSKDILHDPSPRTMKFESLERVIYRMVSSQGHLFILGSKELYCLCGVAEQFLNGTLDANDGNPLLRLPMTAIDLNLVQDRLAVVELDRIRTIAVDAIQQSMPDEKIEKPQACSPVWKSDAVSARGVAVA